MTEFTLNKIINATHVFAPIFHELISKIEDFFFVTQKAYFSQILLTNLSKSVLVNEIIIHLTGVAYQDVIRQRHYCTGVP